MDENPGTIEGGATDHVELTVNLVSAYVANNHLQPNEIASLIASTHAALTGLGKGSATEASAIGKLTPFQIRKSITHEALISFIDGKPYKTMKRHLMTNGLTPEQYRERFGLPRDYPVTASSYSEQRSKLALALGLGNRRRKAFPKIAELSETVPDKPKRTAGRPRKVKES